jgi:hypothetical protein
VNDTQIKMAAMIAQNELLQDQLLALQESSMSLPIFAEDIVREVQQHPAEAFPINVGYRQGEVIMEEDKPMPTRGGGAGLERQAQAQDGNSDCNGDDISYVMVDTPDTGLPAKPPTEKAMEVEAICHFLLPHGSGISPEVWPLFYPHVSSLKEPSVFTANSLSTSDVDDTSNMCNQNDCQESKILATTSLAILPPGEVYVPFPHGSGKMLESTTLVPGICWSVIQFIPHQGLTPGLRSRYYALFGSQGQGLSSIS